MNYNFSSLKLYFSLSTEDKKSFSFFFRRNYPSKKSFDSILKYLKKNEKTRVNYDSEKLAKLIFKDSSKNKELGTLMSAFEEKCREWLLLEDHKNGSIESEILVLDIINKRGLSEEIYNKRSKRIQKLLNKSSLEDISSEYNKWKTTHDAFFHSSFNHIQQREKELLLTQSESNLDNFYLLVKLQYAYEGVVTKRLVETVGIEQFLPEADKLLLKTLETKHHLKLLFLLLHKRDCHTSYPEIPTYPYV